MIVAEGGDADLCGKLKAYLGYRSRNADPPPPLVDAWEYFYWSYAPRIRSFLRRYGLSDADRDDCLQDVWSEVISHLADLRYDPRRARFSTWMMTIVRNKAVDAVRRRQRQPAGLLEHATAVEDSGPGPAAACERNAMLEQLERVLTELSKQAPPLSFQVFYLRAIDGRTNTDVADTLGLSPDQVRFRLHRMKRKFRHLFERSEILLFATGEGDNARNCRTVPNVAQHRRPFGV